MTYQEKAHQRAQVVPDLGYAWVEADCTGVGIERVTVLVDAVVKHANRTPERRIAAIPIDGLLVCFVGLVVLPLRHVAATEKVPALRVCAIWRRMSDPVTAERHVTRPFLHVEREHSPEETDFSRYSMACSWLLKLSLCW